MQTKFPLKARVADLSRQRANRRLGAASVLVYETLRRQILDGELKPGTPLGHRAIGETMNTSTGPVVSALRRLAHDGLITYVRGHGATVTEFSDEQLDDLMMVRRALETEAARVAARRASPEDLARLYAIVDRMAEAVRERKQEEADLLDAELHVSIAQMTRSPGLMAALERCHLLDMVRRHILASYQQQHLEELEVIHRELVDAIASGDPNRAGQAMHAHLSHRFNRNGPQLGGPVR